MKRLCRWVINFVFLILFFIPLLLSSILSRFLSSESPRLVFGCDPVINFSYYCRAMRAAGYYSKSLVTEVYSINKRSDWDYVISDYQSSVPKIFRPLTLIFFKFSAFLYCLNKFDVFFTSFNGFLLGHKTAFFFFYIAGKKVVILPYGSDGYVYRRIRSLRVAHSLMIDYFGAAKIQRSIQRQVDFWCRNADAVIPGIMGPDGYGRWDVLIPSHLFIDLEANAPSTRRSGHDGRTGVVVIAHSPNHRGVKGTEWIIEAVNDLRADGYKIELMLLENMPNSLVLTKLREEVDILVEQLNGYGYALSGLEGMMAGIPVISSPQDNEYIEPFRIWSFFDECPIVGSSYKDVKSDLLKLVRNPELRNVLGKAGRAYVEKYHGLDSAVYLFRNVIDYVYCRKQSLIGLFHPVLGEYPNRAPKITHPLIKNRISN